MAEEPVDSGARICKHWLRKGKCVFALECKFLHPPLSSKEDPLISAIDAKPQHSREKGRARRVVAKDGRASVLRRWLVRVFGHKYLNTGSGVVDVAGGKGELSFELLNINSIHSTVFDPRPLEVSRFIRKFFSGYYHRNQALNVYNQPSSFMFTSNSISFCSNKQSSNDVSLEAHLPMHIRGYFEMDSHGESDVFSSFCEPCASATGSNDKSHIKASSIEEAASRTQSFMASNSDPSTYSDINTSISYEIHTPVKNQHSEVMDDNHNLPVLLQTPTAYTTGASNWYAHDEYTIPENLVKPINTITSRTINSLESNTVTGEKKHANMKEEDQLQHTTAEKQKASHFADLDYETIPDNTIYSDTTHRLAQYVIRNQPLNYETARSVMENCSIIVGMHADQATEHIIDFAVRNNKPFAVIPCCVHAKLFPKRRVQSYKKPQGDSSIINNDSGVYLKNLTPVRRYGELIDYLLHTYNSRLRQRYTYLKERYALSLAKIDGGENNPPVVIENYIESVELDFDGRNVLLYFLGPLPSFSSENNPDSNDNIQVGQNNFVTNCPSDCIPAICRGKVSAEYWHSIA